MTMELEDWTRHIGLLIGLPDLDDETRAQIARLGEQGYTDRAAAEFMLKYLGVDRRDSGSAGGSHGNR